MSKSFTIKKYWILTLCLLFCSLTAVAQELSDQTTGFNEIEVASTLKKLGIKEQDMTREISIMRKMHTRRYLALEKIKKNILQNNNSSSQSSKKSSTLTAKTMTVTTVDIPQSEKDVLQAFYAIAQSKNLLIGWNFDNPVTSWNSQNNTGWKGVTVIDGHVTELNLNFQIDLNGSFPSNINQLSKLKMFVVSSPNLNGTIPKSISQLTELETLSISNTKLSGSIPNEIGQLSKLKNLLFYENELTGDIPQEVFQLRNLETLYMYGFTGYIPSSIGQLNKLFYLDLNGTSLRGTLPAELGQLSKLEYLSIYNSPRLTGTIPAEIFQLQNLHELYITYCPNLTGSLPRIISQANIYYINLYNNNLTGEIPAFNCPSLNEIYFFNNQFSSFSAQFGQFTAPFLGIVNLSYNKLSGPIPPALFQIGELNLSHNELSGPLPTNIGNVYNLDLSYNKFTGSIPLFSNISNLNYLEISNNQLSGPISSQVINSLPSNLIPFSIVSNKYTFLDLINTIRENPAFESRVTYWPQGKIGQPKTVDTTVDYVVQLSMDYNNSPDDTFQWYKGISPNGVLYENPGTNSNSDRLVFEDVAQSASGYYYFKTTSRFFGDSFVMESEPIKLNVLCYPQTNGTLNVTSSDLVVGQPINFSFESATPNLTYRWTFYNLAGEVSGTSTLSNANASQRYSQPGDYKIKLEVTQQSCITTFEKTFTVVSCTPVTGIIKIIKNVGYPFQFSNSGITSVLACNEIAFPNTFYADTESLNIGTKLYTNQNLSTSVSIPNSFAWYKAQGSTAYKIDATGKITEVYTCSASTCNKRFLDYVTVVAQEPITLNYFLSNGTEVNKTFEPVPRGGDQTYTFSIAACISETSLTIDGPVLNQTVAWNDSQNCCQATSRAYRFSSPGRNSASLVCPETSFPDTFYAASTSLGIGTQLYLDAELKNKVGSGNTWRKEGIDGLVIRIANDGTVAQFDDCGAEQPATTTYYFRAAHPLGHTGRDYIRYIDAAGNEVEYEFTRYEGTLGPCEEIIAQSILYKTGLLACTPGQD